MNTPLPFSGKERLDSIQVLRAFAAIAVVTHHIPMLANGAWGVDLFFVISGFIMCYVTEESSHGFLTKRIIRIVPLYWGGTIFLFLLAMVVPKLLSNTSANIADLVKSMLFIPFQKGNRVQPILFLGWTLNYEMFFYVVFATAMAVSHKNRALLSSLALIAVAVAGVLVDFQWIPLKFLSGPIVLEFVFGMLCYAAFVRTSSYRSRMSSSRARWGWIVIGAMLLACMPLQPHASSLRIVEWGVPAALGFYAIIHGSAGIRFPSILVLLGDASFSLYLFHPYVLRAFERLLPAFVIDSVAPMVLAGLEIIVCCALSLVSYRFLEKPVTEWLRKRSL